MLQNDILLKHLSTVMDPELGVNIVDLGMVKDITYTNSEVTIDLALTIAECPMRNQIETEIKRKLKLIENIEEVYINVVEMSKEDRSSLMTIARKNARDNAIPTNINTRTRVIAVGSGKGGVGKSTTTVNLATVLSEKFKVGILDLDIYGPSLPTALGCQEQPKMGSNNLLVPIEKYGMKLMSFGFLNNESAPTIWRGPMVSRMTQQFFEQVEWGELDILFLDLPPGTGDIQLTLVQKVALSGALIITTPQDLALLDVKKASYV